MNIQTARTQAWLAELASIQAEIAVHGMPPAPRPAHRRTRKLKPLWRKTGRRCRPALVISHADRTACTSHCSRLWKSVSVSDDQATEVVEAFEEHLAVKIKEANARLEAQMKGLEAQQKAQTWLIGTLGSVIAIGVLLSALSPIITKMIR